MNSFVAAPLSDRRYPFSVRRACPLRANPLGTLARLGLLGVVGLSGLAALPGYAADLSRVAPDSLVVGQANLAGASAYEGVVEAVRQTVVSAQVPGVVTQLLVRAGDRVAAGAVLARIDAHAAEQGVVASQAQVDAAEAQWALAGAELERKRQLFAKNYISRAALDQAEAAQAAGAAQVKALRAQVGVASAQTGFHVIRAPYAGVVASLQATQGDMAMPGRPLLTLYDPSAMRVAASVPASVLARLGKLSPDAWRLEVSGLEANGERLVPARIERLPTVDAQSLTQVVRADVSVADARRLSPGQFARVWLAVAPAPEADSKADRGRPVAIPIQAVVRRSELTAVYVIGTQGQAELRQVRLGQIRGDQVEVLAGLDAGERIATQPAQAVRR